MLARVDGRSRERSATPRTSVPPNGFKRPACAERLRVHRHVRRLGRCLGDGHRRAALFCERPDRDAHQGRPTGQEVSDRRHLVDGGVGGLAAPPHPTPPPVSSETVSLVGGQSRLTDAIAADIESYGCRRLAPASRGAPGLAHDVPPGGLEAPRHPAGSRDFAARLHPFPRQQVASVVSARTTVPTAPKPPFLAPPGGCRSELITVAFWPTRRLRHGTVTAQTEAAHLCGHGGLLSSRFPK
jgi:hypothetical protein